jgi:hypothetical protein
LLVVLAANQNLIGCGVITSKLWRTYCGQRHVSSPEQANNMSITRTSSWPYHHLPTWRLDSMRIKQFTVPVLTILVKPYLSSEHTLAEVWEYTVRFNKFQKNVCVFVPGPESRHGLKISDPLLSA